VNARVERLYEVFAMPRPAVVQFCDHCVDAADVAPFTSIPLRQLTSEHVERFWLKSGTIGDETFVRYLLPRVLELIADEAIEADFFWLALATGVYSRGGPEEQSALEEYFEGTPLALAALVLEEIKGGGPVGGRLRAWLVGDRPIAVLEAFALGGGDVDGVGSDAHLVLETLRLR
jgi:hypothetical protein